MPGLLYPAYQKFYNALSSLERFDKEQNFFDNISSLDNFFLEYRNITFVIQSALKHTKYFDAYISNRDKYLTDHWFVEKRNEIAKEQPFRLIKKLDITMYYPAGSVDLHTQSFTVEDDIPLSSLMEELKNMFSGLNLAEVFFSAKFSFYEKDKDVDIWDKLISGIALMQKFMDSLYNEIGENCPLCIQLRNKISGSKFSLFSKELWLINDYIYYPFSDKFERANRVAMVLSADGNKVANHGSIEKFTESKYFNYDGTPFGKFVLMHACIRLISPGADIMPAIMILYGDGTYDLDVFYADVKTTVYRKINEVAEQISNDDIKEVFFMSLYTVVPYQKDVPITAKERQCIAENDILAFMRVDCNMNEEEYVFDGKLLDSEEYLLCTMKYGRKNKLDIGLNSMTPIWRAFKKKRADDLHDDEN